MLNRAGGWESWRGKWIIYKNLSWHLLSNVERWRQNSCYCCRKQSAGDWIKVSRKWLLDSLLFSLIQLDVSLSCQLGITVVWFINTLKWPSMSDGDWLWSEHPLVQAKCTSAKQLSLCTLISFPDDYYKDSSFICLSHCILNKAQGFLSLSHLYFILSTTLCSRFSWG